MHQYLRSVGFSLYKRQTDIENLLEEFEARYMDSAKTALNEYGEVCVELRAQTARNMGVAIAGIRDEEGKFRRQYYYPYITSDDVTTLLPVSVERHVDDRSLKASVEDNRIGVSLIFSLDNTLDYIEMQTAGKAGNGPIDKCVSKLAGLCNNGKVLLPSMQRVGAPVPTLDGKRNSLIEAAKSGDPQAMEQLALQEMSLLQEIDERLKTEDMYSIVDQCVMPMGVECDIYMILGRIEDIAISRNLITGEDIYDLTVNADETTFHIGINAADLEGEPQVGRRFKGQVWMMGRVSFYSSAG